MKQRLFIPIAIVLALLRSSTARPYTPAPALQEPAPTAVTGRQEQPASTPSGVPTPFGHSPEELLSEGERDQRFGHHENAVTRFETLLEQYPQTDEARNARYKLAESLFQRQEWGPAIEALQAFLSETPTGAELAGDPLRERALILLGRSYENIGQHQLAVDTYLTYEAEGGPLSSYIAVRRAAQLGALGLNEQAAAAYEQGAAGELAREDRAAAYEAAISLREGLGQLDAALADLEQILTFAENPGYRAQLLDEGASRAETLGYTDRRIGFLVQLLEYHPSSALALNALERLQALGHAPDPFSAGRTLFQHERYADALPLLAAASASPRSPEEGGKARQLYALALRAGGDYAQAETLLSALADEQPDTSLGREARMDAIQTRGQAGDVQGAIDGYQAFANQYPDDPLAPEALRRVSVLLARSDEVYASLMAQIELGRRYPSSNEGRKALTDAARQSFQEGHFDQALEAWKLLADQSTGELRAQGLYWAARLTNDRGDAQAAAQLMQATYQAAPDSYYGARAADLLGIQENAGLEIGALLSEEQRQHARDWIYSWYENTQTVDAQTQSEVVHARELEAAHLDSEAINQWLITLERWKENPAALFEIGLQAHDAGNERITMRFGQAIAALAPPEAGDLPPAVRRLLYPTPYTGEVLQQSLTYGMDPRLIYAAMRQESRYNPGATSWVGARGLMQVMPATGEGIAAALGVSGFAPDDLYDPSLSIRFGTYYLSAQQKSMNGSIHGALAAYNGGLGNARRWASGNSVLDPDHFLLSIDFAETRHYVEVIYGFYGGYKRLYTY